MRTTIVLNDAEQHQIDALAEDHHRSKAATLRILLTLGLQAVAQNPEKFYKGLPKRASKGTSPVHTSPINTGKNPHASVECTTPQPAPISTIPHALDDSELDNILSGEVDS